MTGTLHEDVFTFVTISHRIVLRMRYVLKEAEKFKIHILCSIILFPKICRLWDNVEKTGWVREATNYSTIRRMRVECRISDATSAHAYAHAHASRRARAHTHTHTHTYGEISIILVFPRQQWRQGDKMAGVWNWGIHCGYTQLEKGLFSSEE